MFVDYTKHTREVFWKEYPKLQRQEGKEGIKHEKFFWYLTSLLNLSVVLFSWEKASMHMAIHWFGNTYFIEWHIVCTEFWSLLPFYLMKAGYETPSLIEGGAKEWDLSSIPTQRLDDFRDYPNEEEPYISDK